jgi:hypothetical protein
MGFVAGLLCAFFLATSGCSDRDNITNSNELTPEGTENFSVRKFVLDTRLESDTLKLPFNINDHDVLIFAYRSIGGNPNLLSPTRNYRIYNDEIWLANSGEVARLVVLDLGKKLNQ